MIDSIEDEDGTAHTADTTIPVDGYTVGAPSTPPTLGSTTCGTGESATSYVTSTAHTSAHVWSWVTSSKGGDPVKVTTTTTTDTATSQSCDGGTIYKVARVGPSTAQNYTLNMVQDVLNDANTATFVTMVTALQTGNDSTYGAGYSDPNEPTSPNLKTDTAFNSDVNAIYVLYNAAKDYHDDVMGDGSAPTLYQNGVAHTYVTTNYDAFLAGIATFQTAMKLRITEISNRIGYLNGKGSQTGGIADGGSGTQSTGHSTTNGGFAGTDFNGGKGYANTIYSHANFLAGKKINLLGKVLKAIVSVQAMYDSVEKKRSEYYEYNQAT